MRPTLFFSFALLLAGCLTTPVSQHGGPGSVTVPNTNPRAIFKAARAVFAEYGYSPGPGKFPQTISFDRPAGAFGELMFGSYNRTTTFRVQLEILPLPGSNDFRLAPRVSRISHGSMAGFERDTNMMRFWSGQFRPILRDIKNRAANAGPGA